MKIGIIAAAVISGLPLGRVVPTGLIKESWRTPIAILLVAAGLVLAVIGFVLTALRAITPPPQACAI